MKEESQAWAQRYYEYRKFTDYSNDPAAIRSREKFAASRARAQAEAAAPLPSSSASASAKPEGRRTGNRFATEYDFERALRESEQEAREQKEKDDRLARAKTASAKEATIPPMMDAQWWEEELYKDRTHKVSFARSFARLEFGEPIDNFTEEEIELFDKTYLEFPKQWSEIAAALPNRDFKACIQHYYLVKHSSRLKERVKDGKKKKRGRGAAKKTKSNVLTASLGNADDAEEGQEAENGSDRRRPRRAAAPVFPIDAPPSENEVASPAPTPGRKAAATPKADNGNENGPPKKKVKATREKGTKQAKNNQLLAAAPIAAAARRDESPATPAPSEGKNRRSSVGPSRLPPHGLDGASSTPQPPPPLFPTAFAPIEKQTPVVPENYPIMPQPYPVQDRVDPAIPVTFDSQQDRRNVQQTSSYWSVPEQNDFPALLRHFGTDWQGIAKWMTSKTHIMVKNYYQRQVDSGKKEWEDITKEADEKRERNESTGPLPIPTIIPKRRYDAPSGPVPRSGSAIDDIDSMSSPGPAALSQASPPQSQPTLSARFPALANAGPVPHIQPATVVSKQMAPQPAQQHVPPPQQGRPRGPPLGVFYAENPRPLLQAQHSSDSAVSQRSRQAAQEAQAERDSALRLEREQREREQREQQQQQQQQREQQQQAVQAALQRERQERQFKMKQEHEPNLHQYEHHINHAAITHEISTMNLLLRRGRFVNEK
ncbi:hypothetical protein G7Y89_g15859 [Cudoniella acicularis]|uniref:SANT domain-containing protein n=1 Tax=Cudoniella acicularis TaxID=354080 RepID=A0A8H4QFH1_9HELO|nr:hypothetical protein G7Y89_g15859 [Cudoniella acicularis]